MWLHSSLSCAAKLSSCQNLIRIDPVGLTCHHQEQGGEFQKEENDESMILQLGQANPRTREPGCLIPLMVAFPIPSYSKIVDHGILRQSGLLRHFTC